MLIDNVSSVRNGLRDKVAVVTGAGRGIGRETARVFARLGAKVVVAEVSESGAETARLIRSEGGEAMFVRTDVSDETSVTRLYDAAESSYGPTDILVNNAAALSYGPVWEHSLTDWDRVIAVNLRGAFICIKTFLPDMLARQTGVVVTMESADGMPYLAPYLVTKAGLRSMALSLAAEVPNDSGVSVFCFAPGMVETPGITEALERLPHLYGMSREEFIQQSGVAMLSAEACATGLAGAILHAGDFHGQEVGFAAGLNLLGLNGAGQPTEAKENPASVPGTAEVTPQGGTLEALALNRELEEILRANIREYSELTLFQRPIVKRMFQQGTGMKVEEWLSLAQRMTQRLERWATGESGLTEQELRSYVATLERLDTFILKQESDARGFFRNQETLDRALEALRARRKVVTELTLRLKG